MENSRKNRHKQNKWMTRLASIRTISRLAKQVKNAMDKINQLTRKWLLVGTWKGRSISGRYDEKNRPSDAFLLVSWTLQRAVHFSPLVGQTNVKSQ
jgi:hypothetical protein